MIERKQIIDQLVTELQARPFVNALWEAGSASFDRVDEFSDLDIMIDVDDEFIDEAFTAVESALNSVTTIIHQYEVPQPTWHGHHQRFYNLANVPEFLMIDCAVVKTSSNDKFLTREVHGNPRVLFDKTGVVKVTEFDHDGLQIQLRKRIGQIEGFYEIVKDLPRKELLRGQPIDALSFYNGLVIRPLVELLRIKYDPTRFNWSARYLHHYLPAKEAERVQSLMYVGQPDDLPERFEIADQWITELVEELNELF